MVFGGCQDLRIPPSRRRSLSDLSSAFWRERFSASFPAQLGPFALVIWVVWFQLLAVVFDLPSCNASDVNGTRYVAGGSPFVVRSSSHKESLALLQIRHNGPNNQTETLPGGQTC